MEPSLDALKTLFSEGFEYAKENTGFYFRPDEQLCRIQEARVADAQTYQEFASAVQIYNYARQFGYPPTEPPITSDMLLYSNFQFDSSIHGTYGIFGTTDNYGFAFTLSRNEIAPPHVSKKHNSSDNVIWQIYGGFAALHENKWNAIPFEWLVDTHYEKWSNRTFYFDGRGPDRIKSIKFVSPEPMEFELDITYDDHRVKLVLRSNAAPTILETNKYIYANMSVDVVIDNSSLETGKGSVAHAENLAPPISFAAQTRFVRDLSMRKHSMLIFLQFQSYQYAFLINVTRPLASGDELDKPYAALEYSYGNTRRIAVKDVSIGVTTVLDIDDKILPTGLLIRVKNKYVTCLNKYGEGIVRNSYHQADYHAPLHITDANLNEGSGFIQFENVLNDEEWSLLTFGQQDAAKYAHLLANQPHVSRIKRDLAQLLYVLFYVTIIAPVVVLSVFVFIILIRVFKSE